MRSLKRKSTSRVQGRVYWSLYLVLFRRVPTCRYGRHSCYQNKLRCESRRCEAVLQDELDISQLIILRHVILVGSSRRRGSICFIFILILIAVFRIISWLRVFDMPSSRTFSFMRTRTLLCYHPTAVSMISSRHCSLLHFMLLLPLSMHVQSRIHDDRWRLAGVRLVAPEFVPKPKPPWKGQGSMVF